MDRLTEMAVFVQVAETGSLNRAAEKLGLSNASASRHLSALEDRLGVRLVERNTRRLYLTEPGQEFLRRSKQILIDLEQAESVVNAAVSNPTGTLRIAAPLSLSVHHIAPLLPAYAERYPNVTVQVETAQRSMQLIDHDIDVAIRTGAFEPDPGIAVRRLADMDRVLAAAPAYLDRAGIPRTPPDLASHALLACTLDAHPHELRFNRRGEAVAVEVHGALESNDDQVLRAAALAGVGVLALPRYVLRDDLAAGRLMPLLDDWRLPRLEVDLAYPDRKHLAAKVRTFIDFMVEHFQRMEREPGR